MTIFKKIVQVKKREIYNLCDFLEVFRLNLNKWQVPYPFSSFSIPKMKIYFPKLSEYHLILKQFHLI